LLVVVVQAHDGMVAVAVPVVIAIQPLEKLLVVAVLPKQF
jgi:hypothetical protein